MTDPGEFRSQPKPGDWIIPPEIEAMLGGDDGMGPVELSIIKEHELDGVPIPFVLQSIQEMAEQLDRLDNGEDPVEIVAEMIADFAEKEKRYPGTDMWDTGRCGTATRLIEHGRLEEASQILATVCNARLAVKALLDSGENGAISPKDTAELLTGMIHDGDHERAVAVARASRDNIIANELPGELVDTFNDMLVELLDEPNFDWVKDWVESQREARPDINWDPAEPWLKDDGSYAGMPMPQRMHNYIRMMDTMKLIDEGGMNEEIVAAIVEYYGDVREAEAYGEARIFDRELGSFIAVLIEKGDIDFAVELAAAIHDMDIVRIVAAKLTGSGHEEKAVELAVSNSDPKMTAVLLLDVEYLGNEGLEKLTEIIQSDEYPAETRLGCLEVVHDRMVAGGHYDMAVKYKRMIDEIRKDG